MGVRPRILVTLLYELQRRTLSHLRSNVSKFSKLFNLLDERALAGHTFPLAVLLDPGVRESRAPRVQFSLGHG